MKELTHYYKNGYDFAIVKRQGNLAIAKGISRQTGRDNWEIIEIQSHNGLQMGNNWVEPSEYCPNSESWSQKGWTGINEADAERIFLTRLQERQLKEVLR